MFELLYTSVAADKLASSACDSLLKHAQAFNKEHDITGMLVFDGYLFMQILEGDQSVIEALFEKIKRDPRHVDVICQYSGAISKPGFEGWSMAYERIESGDIEKAIQNVKTVIALTSKVPHPNTGVRLFRARLRYYQQRIGTLIERN